MKTLKQATLLSALAISGCAAPQADILQVLESAASECTPLYGHQDDLMYGHSWNATKDGCKTLDRSDVLSTSGDYPALLGLDLGGIEFVDDCNLDGNGFEVIREGARTHAQRGGVVTLSWHMRNPYTGGDAWDVSSNLAVRSVLPGGEKHGMFMGWLGNAADFIEGLGIPVIFRPYHEHTGTWFWWCDGVCTPEEYNALWVMTYDYFVKERGIGNIIWAISPNLMPDIAESLASRYPGDAYVDVVGLDFYQMRSADESVGESCARYVAQMRSGLEIICGFAREHGKISAVTETGFEGLPDPAWWTGTLAPALEGYPVAYVLTWRNSSSDVPPFDKDHHFYAPWPGQQSEADFRAWCGSGKVKMLKHIQ